jgi:hypothetical protein
MKHIGVIGLACLAAAGFAQDVQFDYNRSADFGSYRTYQWVDFKPVDVGNQILDQDIKRAVDAQLAGKGLQRVESGGDLLVGYETAISQKRHFDVTGWAPGRWAAPAGSWVGAHVTSSNIDVGKLVVGLFDPATKQLVWRGSASKTLDIKKDPDKNYRTLEKAMAKLFKHYPPAAGKR